MNLTNPSSEYEHERNSSSDDDDGGENDQPDKRCEAIPSIRIEQFFSDDDDDEVDSSDDDQSDIENHSFIKNQLPPSTRLSSLLRQSNRLVELKLNLLQNRPIHSNSTNTTVTLQQQQQQQQQQLLRHALSESDMSKRSHHYQTNQQNHEHQQSILLPSFSSNQFYLSTNQSHRLYLPTSSLYDLQTQINNWLQASTFLIDSISTLTYHRQCWSQLLLTYLIEQGYIHLEFLRCTHSCSSTMIHHHHPTCADVHQHGCVPEEDAYKLCSILQKGSRFNINSIIFDHIRRIIVIKSIQERKQHHSLSLVLSMTVSVCFSSRS